MNMKSLIPEKSLADDIMATRLWFDREVASIADPRRQLMLARYRDHWWCEVIGDLEGVMATMAPNPKYRAYGSDVFGEFLIDTTEETEKFYRALFASGFYPAGPFTETRYALADWGLMIEAINTAIIPGSFFPALSLEPNTAYKASWRLVGIHPFDENCLMEAEILYVGRPYDLTVVTR